MRVNNRCPNQECSTLTRGLSVERELAFSIASKLADLHLPVLGCPPHPAVGDLIREIFKWDVWIQLAYHLECLAPYFRAKPLGPIVFLIGEALGAIGNPEALDLLKEYSADPVIEVAETCQLAVKRMEWLQTNQDNPEANPYQSVDPAPPLEEKDVVKLQHSLLNESLPLFDRYRAMFALRNIGGEAAVLALAEGLKCGSALFRHEIGYVLGQMQHEACIPQLKNSLECAKENPMVRHECAEALGSIAKDACLDTLRAYVKDEERVVRESCEVALDMFEYEKQ